MVVPDPPLSRKQDKDAVVQIASTLAPTPSQEFSQFKGCSSSVTSHGDSPAGPDDGFNDIVTNTEPSHLSNLVLFAKNKTPSESVWKNKYSGYSKVRAGSQSSSNSCPQKYVRNKNLKFDVKYGIACAIPELYAEDTYSGQNYSNSDYIYSASFYDTPVTYSHHDISTGVNGSLSSPRYKTSNFPLISVGKGLHHQVEGQFRVQFSQSVYNAQDLQESSSVTSGSSKKRWKNKNSKLRKEAFSTLRTDSVKPFLCLYGKIVHTDDCKCLKINLWKRCLLPVCYPSKVSNSDTTAFGNFYQNNLDEDVYDVQVSSLSEEVTTDTTIGVSAPESVTKRIHSGQSCTTKLEPICESAKETDNHLIEFGLETDLGIGEEIAQQYNTGTADLRVFSSETADTVLPSIYQTCNYSSREESQSPFLSESKSLKVEHYRHTYDSVKNLPPFISVTSRAANLTTGLEGKVQVIEPSQLNALSAATAGLTQNLYNLVDVVQHTQTKNNIKASERPATKDDLAPCLALFDNLVIDIDNQLEEQVPYKGESSIDEEFGQDPWAALSSQSTTTMASQGKKNKNQFVRKAAPPSPVNKTGEGGSSGVSSPDITNKQMSLVEVGIESAAFSIGRKDRNVTNKIELTQGSPPEFGLEQHGIPSNAGVGDAPHTLRQKYDLGGFSTPSSVNIQYSGGSSSVPTVHSHPYSSPNTGSNSQSAYPDSTGSNGTPPLYKTQSPVPPAKPPRTFKSETMDQHSASSMHKEAQLGSAQILGDTFSNAQQQQSSRLQRQGRQQFANNFDDDDQWYLRQRQASYHPSTASEEDVQFEYLEEQARVQYEGSEILFNNGQKGNSNQSTLLQTQVGKNLRFYMNEQEQGQFPSMHLSNKTHYSSVEHEPSGQHEEMIPRVPDAGKMGQTSSGHLDSGMDEMKSGQNSGQMEQQQSWQHRGFSGGGQQEGLKQMPGTEHGRSMQPVQRGLQDGILGQMHPHAQLNAMQVNEQGFKENVQGEQSQQGSMAQDCHIPTDHRHGDGQSSDTYSHGEGISDYRGKSSYMTDRELAQDQMDQRMNNPWFRNMVQNMKELVEREGLVVKDVFPDGNCLFTTVIDQLRVRGNFNFTPSTLRAAAVAFLRENPKQHDGTHLEQFLMNESWDHYLGRICKDGEWGEHIILGAVSEVLKCRIIVLGGMSGNSRTVVQPQHMSDEDEKKLQKEKKEANGSKTVKDGSLTETEVTGAESQPMQTGTASSTSKADANTKGTDTSHRKDKTDSLSKQNKEKKDEEPQIGEDLYIGLLGEMHYVSLRKKDWEERLNEKLRARIKKRKAKQRQEAGQENDSISDDDLCLPEDLVRRTMKSKGRRSQKGNANADSGFWSELNVMGTGHTDVVLPIPHLDFLVNYIFNSEYIMSMPEVMSDDFSGERFSVQIFGSEFLPGQIRYPIHSSKRLSLDSLTDNDYKERKLTGVYFYCIPGDTRVVPEGSRNMARADLILHELKSPRGFTRLIPTTPFLWYPAIVSDQDGNTYLKHLHCNLRKTTTGMNNDGRLELLICFRSRWSTIATDWLFRKRPAMWPNSDILEQVTELDTFIIPRGSDASNSSSDIEWEISFAQHEKCLMANAVTKPQKMCFHLMMQMVDSRQDRLNEDFLQILKTVFFYACETIPVKKWALEPVWCVLYMFSRIKAHLEARSLPHYFLSSRNILQDLSERRINEGFAQIEILHFFPLFSIYSFCDDVGLCRLKPGKFLDDIFEVLSYNTDKSDYELSFVDTFCPKLIEMSQRMVDKGDCYSASVILASIPRVEDLMGILYGGVQICSTLLRLPDIERWCMGFCMDRMKGLNMSHIIFPLFEQSKLSELMGPVVEKCIGDINIPTSFTDLSTVCEFLHKFASILSLLALDEVVIEGLKFFLQKYQRNVCDLIINLERHSMDNMFFLPANAKIRSVGIKVALMQLYTKLIRTCTQKGYAHHLFDMMDSLENAAEVICSKVVYELVADIFKMLGNYDKMNLYKAHAASMDYIDDPVKTLPF